MLTLEGLGLATLAAWIVLYFDRRRAWPAELVLDPEPPASESRVVAVVPARDEAGVLPETLPSLLAQPGLSVVVVDDRSEDGTGELARRLAADAGAGERCVVVAPEPPPPGWSGKVHALASGVAWSAEHRPPEWFLFTDADIRHPSRSLAALLATAAEGGYDLVSVMARLHARSFWERLLIPPFVYFFQLLYPFRQVRRPESRVAAAAGGCVLVRAAALERAGGLASIRGAVIDDVALGRRIKDSGGRLWLGFDPEIVSVRPYRGLGELWDMVARSAFVQLRRRWDLLVLAEIAIAVFLVSPPWVAAAGATLALAGGPPSVARAALWAVLAWLLQTLALLPAVRHHRVGVAFAATLPFASLVYGLMTFSSGWSHLRGRGARWKGRSYGSRVKDPELPSHEASTARSGGRGPAQGGT